MKDKSSSPMQLALGGAVAMACAMGIGRFVYTPILPSMIEGLQLSASEAGLIASANFLGYLLGALAASIRLPGSPRVWLLGALAASAVTTGAVGLCSESWPIAILRFLGGIASAFALIFASTQVLEALAKAGRSGLASVHFGGVGVGIAVSSLVILLPVGWQGMWFVAGALSLVGVLAVGVLARAAQAPSSAALPPSTPAVPARGGLGRLILAYGLFGFGYVITATFLIAIIRGAPTLKPFEPIAWLLVGLAGAPSVWLWNTFGRRFGLERAYALASVVEAAGVLLSLWSVVPGIVLSAILLGGTFMGLTALGLEAARRRAPGNPRRAVGLMTAAFGVGQIVGPTAAGYARDWTGSFALATLAAAVALIVAAGLTVVQPRGDR